MLFHAGALKRLHELGLLAGLDRISSVSGGSITAAVVALAWDKLAARPGDPAVFDEAVIKPLRRMARTTIDVGAIVKGALLPGTAGDRIAAAYNRVLLRGARLSDLPNGPRFVFCATNVQSAALARFARDGLRDWRVGNILCTDLRLSAAVAASSAFPPFLSPNRLDLSTSAVVPGSGSDLEHAPFTLAPVLTDGGVYDNLGLETIWKRCRTVLVSDAGGKIDPQPRTRADWLRHLKRVLDVVDDQVRNLRKRQLIEGYRRETRQGTYWGIRSNIARYAVATRLPTPDNDTLALAMIPTRLARMPERQQEALINWGYAISDAALRRHLDPQLPAAESFPYPDVGTRP